MSGRERPYRVLGVTPDASDDEVHSKYRALSKVVHPGGDAITFAVLRDADKEVLWRGGRLDLNRAIGGERARGVRKFREPYGTCRSE